MKFTLIILSSIILYACTSNTSQDVDEKVHVVNDNNSTNETATAPEKVVTKDVTGDEFKGLMGEHNYQLIDVRTPEEFNSGNIEGARNLDFLGENFENEIQTLDKNKPVLVYCQAGGRSSKAMKVLVENGFTEVYNLLGGYGQWSHKK
ncbi:MAG: rhodanese-like domain-containing protein [Putridiphycobacter sp.]|nr:rhodanese-like domain-containing protein [Putridiphycobacter sp.]